MFYIFGAKVALITHTYKFLYSINFIFRNIFLVIWRESNIFAWFL